MKLISELAQAAGASMWSGRRMPGQRDPSRLGGLMVRGLLVCVLAGPWAAAGETRAPRADSWAGRIAREAGYHGGVIVYVGDDPARIRALAELPGLVQVLAVDRAHFGCASRPCWRRRTFCWWPAPRMPRFLMIPGRRNWGGARAGCWFFPRKMGAA